MKVILFANTDWYLFNFRLPLARALRVAGHEVLLLSPDGAYGPQMEAEGFRWQAFPFSRKGMNPLRELATIFKLRRLYRAELPDVVHHVTIKCVLYGSLAGHLTGAPKSAVCTNMEQVNKFSDSLSQSQRQTMFSPHNPELNEGNSLPRRLLTFSPIRS